VTQSDWEKVWSAFHAASELPAEERASFLERKLADHALVAKAFELLAELEQIGEADHPANGQAPQLIGRDDNPVSASYTGKLLGRFEILESIGSGGMGEVYRALDTDLRRHIAIKCIAGRRLGSPAAVAAFIREARMASALNHPGIVTIYEVIRTSDTVAIAMELAEGVTLRKLCGAAQPAARVIAWGRQIADALAASHAAGLIHRDLKPENLILRHDGFVKTLDFGLARHHTDATEPDDERVAGTLRYMSPEQARGTAALTPATDVFSLGVVLYELAAGVHPFAPEGRNNTTLSVAGAIAGRAVPPPSSIVPSLPRAFDSLVLRMLDKDPLRRPTAEAVTAALRSLPARRIRRRGVMAGSILAAILAAFGIRAWLKPPEPIEFQGTLLTGAPGRETDPAFSPDGQSVVYAWDGGHGGKRDIWVKRLDSTDPRRLTSDLADEWDPCWLPDASAIAFLRVAASSYNVVTVPVAGGPETIVTSISATTSWLEHRLACLDARNLAIIDEPPARSTSVDLRLYSISLATRERRLISDTPPGAADFWPRVSPDRRRVAFARTGNGYQLRVADISGGASHPVVARTELKGLAWTPDSQNILYQDGASDSKNIWQVPASGGPPRRPAFLPEANAEEIALSPGGRKIAYSRGTQDVNVWRVFADGRPAAELAPSIRNDNDAIWSPDGTSFAFSSDRSGPAEIWVASAAGTNVRRVTNLKGWCGSPAWSPDGKLLAFDFSATTAARVGIVPVESGTARIFPETTVSFVPSWSHDGKWFYVASRRTGNYEIWKIPLAGGPAVQITHHGGFESRESPDGRYLYYSKNNANDIWRLPVSGEGVEEKVADLDHTTQFRCWDLSVQGIAIASPGPKPHVDLLPFAGGRVPLAELPAELPKYSRCLSMHPDGKSFLFPIREADRWEIYVADNPVAK